jgi:hypothetical protein
MVGGVTVLDSANKLPIDTEIRKAISGELTKALNCDDTVYDLTCVYVVRLIRELFKDLTLGPLLLTREIVFVLKGSMAQKRVFCQLYPQYAEQIMATFGFGGDNDCGFLINPDMDDFDKIHELLRDQVRYFVEVNKFNLALESELNIAMANVTSIKVGGVRLEVEAAATMDFQVSERDGMALQHTDEFYGANTVYCTVSDPKFNDDGGNLARFNLCRAKACFKVTLPGVGWSYVGAEILDIATPYQNEARMCEFPKYQLCPGTDGAYTTMCTIKTVW